MPYKLNEIIKLWHNHPNDWNISFVYGWQSMAIVTDDLFISHPLLKDDCSIVNCPDGTVLWNGFDYRYHPNDLLSLIEDMIEMPINEFTDGVFDYGN